jgi:crotonobetainyl-CoA:carnitine CoA-transferase CaiB-like acyl-CoA transferase
MPILEVPTRMFSLKDVKVIDVSQVLAGPFAAMMLGDLGADVIKVEPPEGDAIRRSFGTTAEWGETPGFMSVNRSKRSISLDLKTARGLEIFQQLAARCDVVIQNFRPGVAQRLGISYEQLKPLNERLIYCSISGFGSTGPFSDRAGYDIIAQAMSGIMSVTGEAGGAPCRCGVPVADLSTGIFATVGILGALARREQTGLGGLVENSLLDSALAYSVWEATRYWSSGEVAGPQGSGHHMNAPYQAYRCADGYVTIGANNERLWGRLCRALGHPEWQEDPRFNTAPLRVKHMDELAAEIERAIAGKKRSAVEDLLLRSDVPVGAVRSYDEVLDGEEALDGGMVQHAVYKGRPVRFLASPIKFDGTRIGAQARPPELGEHTDQVLSWLGFSDTEIGALHSRGIVKA